MKFNNRSRLNQGASQQLSTRGVPAAQEEHPPLKLATAYVPPQPYTKQFSPEEALKKARSGLNFIPLIPRQTHAKKPREEELINVKRAG